MDGLNNQIWLKVIPDPDDDLDYKFDTGEDPRLEIQHIIDDFSGPKKAANQMNSYDLANSPPKIDPVWCEKFEEIIRFGTDFGYGARIEDEEKILFGFLEASTS